MRFLSNPSSGKMGYALAGACRDRGARVTLVSGPTALKRPEGVEFVAVESARDMLRAARRGFGSCRVFIASAAVSDFRPAVRHAQKVKKSGAEETLTLLPNPDILAELSRRKGGRLLVGFAAETQGLLANAAAKMRSKRLDLMVANRVGRPGSGFGSDDNRATLLCTGRPARALPLLPKRELAETIVDEVERLLSGGAV